MQQLYHNPLNYNLLNQVYTINVQHSMTLSRLDPIKKSFKD